MDLEIKHRPGRHCASTALCNLANYHGLPWSEPLCFGLGAGLGFFFLKVPGGSPSRFVHVRSADLEEQFFGRIGVPGAGRRFASPMEGERDLCALLDRGLPVLVLTDICYLPYYRSRTHFPGHAVTVWGYDRPRALFLVTDTERVETLEVSFEAMRRARFCKGAYYDLEGARYCLEQPAEPIDLPEAMKRAIAANSRVLTDTRFGFQGMGALARWGERIIRWRDLPDWQWVARFCYQVIERRGTGGGGFRLLYAQFLREAARSLPGVEALGLPEMMMETAGAWSAVAAALRSVSEQEAPDFREAADRIAAAHSLESAYHRTVLEAGW